MVPVSNSVASPRIDAIFGELVDQSKALVQQYLQAARMTLETMIAKKELLRDVTLISSDGAYERNLLVGCGDFSVWAMTWAPGSRTSIHDHRCSCCYGIVQGSLTEVRYKAIDTGRVVEQERAVREEGFIDCLIPSGPNIHMMCNESNEEVISIHIYGYDHRLHSSSIHQEFAVVAG
ncbi:cysteine dioxygenase family protein [Rhizobium sp. Leaf262]|uniref:cysteine dioxygenase family protein n=1 Tax=Rhizobium sp. Leaf262 TaxID=1736312 RepID=UPI000713CCB3|nr:cysteine dioxygenase family protein [Rhizobium sp. Leaf262]KQO75918.1 hypothetical protein ASF29_12080 [Rhizobium sp. Leaf262]